MTCVRIPARNIRLTLNGERIEEWTTATFEITPAPRRAKKLKTGKPAGGGKYPVGSIRKCSSMPDALVVAGAPKIEDGWFRTAELTWLLFANSQTLSVLFNLGVLVDTVCVVPHYARWWKVAPGLLAAVNAEDAARRLEGERKR